MRISLIALLLLAVSQAFAIDIPYGFAPESPLKFKRAVRAMLATRPQNENWIEQKDPVQPWGPGPLTFQLVDGGNVPQNLPGGFATPPGTDGDIVRGGFTVAWIYRGSHDIISYNRAARSKPNVMNLDLIDMVRKMSVKWTQ